MIGLYNFKIKRLSFKSKWGESFFPEYPIRTVQDAFTQLAKCIGINDSAAHGVDFVAPDYRSPKSIIGIDAERYLKLASQV